MKSEEKKKKCMGPLWFYDNDKNLDRSRIGTFKPRGEICSYLHFQNGGKTYF